MKKILTQTPGKLILLGEYAVLEGAPALVTAVNRFARVNLQTAAGKDFQASAPTIGVEGVSFHLDRNNKVCFSENISPEVSIKLNFFSATVEVAARYLQSKNISLAPARINLDTGDFFLEQTGEKLGLGSSAALTIGLLGALLGYAGQTMTNDRDYRQLFNLAVNAHRAAQGNLGSGIDIAASAFGGGLQYQINLHSANKEPEIARLSFPQGLYMRVIWAGKSASTKEFVSRVNVFREKNPGDFNRIMAEMREISAAGCKALKTGNTAPFLEMVQQYYRKMDELGKRCGIPIISAEHRHIAGIVQSNGAVYKPSGAGGGDLGIAFALSEKILENCETELKKAGFKTIEICTVSDGMQIQEVR